MKKKDKKAIESEMGDVLFSLVNYARFIDVDPSNALEKTNQKFITRFNYIENEAKKIEKNINDLSFEEMENYWQAAKKS